MSKFPLVLFLFMPFSSQPCSLCFPDYQNYFPFLTVSINRFPSPTSFQGLTAHRASEFALSQKSPHYWLPWPLVFPTNPVLLPPQSFISSSIPQLVKMPRLCWLILLTYDLRNVGKGRRISVLFLFYSWKGPWINIIFSTSLPVQICLTYGEW